MRMMKVKLTAAGVPGPQPALNRTKHCPWAPGVPRPFVSSPVGHINSVCCQGLRTQSLVESPLVIQHGWFNFGPPPVYYLYEDINTFSRTPYTCIA